jgi:hypothetical protein
VLKGVVGETPVTEANFLAWRTKKEAEDDSGKPALSAEMKEKLARPTGRQLFERDASLYTHAAQPSPLCTPPPAVPIRAAQPAGTWTRTSDSTTRRCLRARTCQTTTRRAPRRAPRGGPRLRARAPARHG